MQKYRVQYDIDTYDIFYITDQTEALAVAKQLQEKYELFGVDIETGKASTVSTHRKAGLHPHMSFIRLLQLYGGDDRIYVFDCMDIDVITFKQLLETKKLIAHNAIFEYKFFVHDGIEPSMPIHCSQIMYDLVKRAEIEERGDSPRLTLGLADAVSHELGYKIPKGEQVSNWNAAELTISQIQYAALDAVLTYKLAKEKLLPRVKKFGLQKIYNKTIQTQRSVVDMELNGIAFDVEAHQRFTKKQEIEMKESEIIALTMFKGVTNLASTKQLSDWAKLNLTATQQNKFQVTATGQLSFNAKTLTALKTIPAIEAYLRFKKAKTLYDGFGKQFLKHVMPITDRIHCSTWLTGQKTGRTSCSDPNFQQSPNDNDYRALFVPAEGEMMIGADYSQIELRAQAEASQDPVMRQTYQEGKDFYKTVAANVYKIPYEEVTADQRKFGKVCALSLGYGMGSTKLRQNIYQNTGTLLAVEEVDKLWYGYKRTVSTYFAWCETMRSIATRTGYAKTVMGRLRRLHHQNTYTTAPNTYIQGSSAQVMFCAMCDLTEKKLPGLKMLAVVHDEILCSCPKKYAEKYCRELEDSMTKGFLEIFPTGTTKGLVEAKSGMSWADVH